MKQRIQWIDVSKGLGIILIILGHVLEECTLRTWISSFHVPLFFVLSGMTCCITQKKSIPKFNVEVKNKFIRLMIPYFVFGGVTYTYWVLIERRFRADLSVSPLKPLLGLFWGSGSDNLTFNAALWFLPCLFVVSCIFVLILNIIKKRKLMICSFVFLALLGIIIGRYSPIRLPWGVDISLFMIIFYAIGYYSYDFISDKIFNTSYNNKLIIGIICLAITGVIGIINKGVAVASVQYGNELLFITTSMSGTLLIVTIAQIIGKNKIIEKFGKSSLIIMGIHEPIRRIILKVISVIIKIGVDEIRVNVLYSIIVCLITSIISLIISIIINKIIPWPIGAYKLKRETVDV